MSARGRDRMGAALALALASFVTARNAHADDSVPSPFVRFGAGAAHAFAIAAPVSAIGAGLTGAFAFGGVDQAARVVVQTQFGSRAVGDVALVAGYALPVALPIALYSLGFLARDEHLARDGAAVFQAGILTLVTTTLLKVSTGRPYPTHGGDPTSPDRLRHPEYAREFHPFGGGKFTDLTTNRAWPSGHASATFAIAGALAACERQRPWVELAAYGVALGVTAGMLVGDRHWLSDVIAGSGIGHAVGTGVGEEVCPRATTAQRRPFDARLVWTGGGALVVGVW